MKECCVCKQSVDTELFDKDLSMCLKCTLEAWKMIDDTDNQSISNTFVEDFEESIGELPLQE